MARRKKSREQKKREKQARLLRREDRWWEPFQKVIRLLPLTSEASKLALDHRQWFRDHSACRPEVVLEPGTAAFPESNQIRNRPAVVTVVRRAG